MITQVGPKKAREMWFLARFYTASEAEKMGLVNTVVPVRSSAAKWYFPKLLKLHSQFASSRLPTHALQWLIFHLCEAYPIKFYDWILDSTLIRMSLPIWETEFCL